MTKERDQYLLNLAEWALNDDKQLAVKIKDRVNEWRIDSWYEESNTFVKDFKAAILKIEDGAEPINIDAKEEIKVDTKAQSIIEESKESP